MSYRMLKAGCYCCSLSMSVVLNLSPLLFLTFRQLYGLSYSQIGLLVLLNFLTQLAMDLLFSLFSHRLSVPVFMKLSPVLVATGLVLFTLWPWFFPTHAFWGLVTGTLLFSAGGGLTEVLTSPLIAAIPNKDPDRQMSRFHSIYAWGSVGMIGVSALYLWLFGVQNWYWLALGLLIFPVLAFCFFEKSQFPSLDEFSKKTTDRSLLRQRQVWWLVLAIFFGGAAECTMSQWSSSYLEAVFGIPKLVGDTLGVALFSLAMAIGRSWYASFGKNVHRIMKIGAVGATLCYLTCALINWPPLALLACGATGYFVSMLWPGSLILSARDFPKGGVLLYAMMACGGDLGASVAPQVIGLITDWVLALPKVSFLGVTGEQAGMRLGLVFGALFPIGAIAVLIRLGRRKKDKEKA